MPRTSLNINQNTYGIRYSRTYSNGVLTSTNTDNPRIRSVIKVRNTVNTPGFRSLKKKREGLPFNTFQYSETTMNFPYGTQSQQWDFPKYTNMIHNVGVLAWGIDFHDEDPISDSLKSSCQAQALQKSLTDLKAMKVNLGVAFAERKKTANLLLSTASRVAQALGSLRKGNVNGVANALGLTQKQVSGSLRKSGSPNYSAGSKSSSRTNVASALSREWLALQYGWKPLVSDVYNSAERLAQISDVRRMRITSSRTVQGFKSDIRIWNQIPARRVAQSRYTTRYIYVFSHSSEILKDLSGLGVTNPAAIAWELLPWSFVIDWFIPIGNYIDVWDATLGLTFEKGSKTVFSKYRAQFVANGGKRVSNTFYQTHGGGSIEKVLCERTKLNSFPLPRLPDLTPHITQNRGVSTLALLRQRLKL